MKVTIEDLLGHAKKKKEQTIKIEVFELGKEFEFKVLDRTEIIEIMTSNSSDRDAEILYNACPIFREEELIKELKCAPNPIEVVGKVLSAATIIDIADVILKKAGFKNTEETIKVIGEEIKN